MKISKVFIATLSLTLTLFCGCALQTQPQNSRAMPENTQTTPSPAASSPEGTASAAPEISPEISKTAVPEKTPEQKKETISVKTPVVDSSKNRINNIKLVIKKLDGYVIKNGEEFSFNKSVGPRTMKKGYKDAIIFVEGEKVKEVGGGICQVATTIYQAALKSEFEITERHQHQREIYYAELGDDATVYYGQLDLKFINNSGHDIKLKCRIDKENVSVTLEEI